MARPKSDEKRNAILLAATRVIVKQGLSAPTGKEEERFLARTRRFLHSFKPSGNRVTIWNKGASK